MSTDTADRSDDWAQNMLEELSGLSDSHDPSDRKQPIFRVADEIRRSHREVYESKLVSIGFYNRGKGDTYKLIYLKDLFHRRCDEGNEERYMAALFTALEQLIVPAIECYRDAYRSAGGGCEVAYEPLSDGDIARTMLVDGCFIIELLYKIHFPGLRQGDDEIFKEGLAATVLIDLILVQNQVPFFILDKLFEMTKPPEEKRSLAQLAQSLPSLVLPALYTTGDRISEDELKRHEFHHLLDLVYKTCTSRLAAKIISGGEGHHDPESVPLEHMESASELEQVIGVKFKKARKGTPWLDITWENGVLRIPPFVADDRIERVLRNLIEYELGMNADPGSWTPVTDYALFLRDLIKSPKDVETLASCGIVSNKLGDNEALCRMFHEITEDIWPGSLPSYKEILEGVNKFSGSRWNVWTGILKRDYFNTPWSVISFLAAVLLLTLTFLQTLYAVRSAKLNLWSSK